MKRRRPPEPKPDARLDARQPVSKRVEIDGGHGDACAVNAGLWAVYARTKYLEAATRGPRTPANDPAELVRLGGELVDLMARSWRAGFKSEDLMRAAFDEIKRRGG